LQQNITETTAQVIRENLVRLSGPPLQLADTAVRIGVGRIDLLAATAEFRFAGLVDPVAVTA
jgi:hypothetical protein